MPSCREVTDLLLDAELDELSDELARSVEAHLAACPDCDRFARGYRAVSRAVREALLAGVPPEDAERALRLVLESLRRDR